MGSRPVSKLKLLGAAQALLRQDDREQASASQQHRRNALLTLLIASLIAVAIACTLGRNKTPATSHPTPTQGVR